MNTTLKTSAELIEESQGLVRSLAVKIHRKLPSQVEVDDLIAYGQIGLAEAARSFDPSEGAQFSTFAYYRIRGAIYDGLSKMTWMNRSQYNRMRCEQMATEALRANVEQGTSTSEETSLSDDVRWFKGLSSALAVVHLATTECDDSGESSALEDRDMPTPAVVATTRERATILRKLVDALPTEAAKLIRAAYFDGMTLQEAGQQLGVSKSWASRLHSRALEQLARSLKSLGVADCEP